jgi:hypothetical protein
MIVPVLRRFKLPPEEATSNVETRTAVPVCDVTSLALLTITQADGLISGDILLSPTGDTVNIVQAYDHARRLKTPKGLTPYEFMCRAWTKQPARLP